MSPNYKLAKDLEEHARNLRPKVGNDNSLVDVYNACCTVLDHCNEKLKGERPIPGKSGPIPKTWQRINKS
ncbi:MULTISPECIES: hypothetical protein [Moorena]|nr:MULTISPECIES: hypothetical protein [Moorena]NEO24019.1 hypothetical protein [Moorena sp. SIO4A5]